MNKPISAANTLKLTPLSRLTASLLPDKRAVRRLMRYWAKHHRLPPESMLTRWRWERLREQWTDQAVGGAATDFDL